MGFHQKPGQPSDAAIGKKDGRRQFDFKAVTQSISQSLERNGIKAEVTETLFNAKLVGIDL